LVFVIRSIFTIRSNSGWRLIFLFPLFVSCEDYYLLCLPDDATTIVLSSDGPASDSEGGCLGQFEFDKTKKCWIQASSDKYHRNYKPRFIYKIDDDGWYVSNRLGKKEYAQLRNDARTNTLPLAGWKVHSEEDPTLSITVGAMETNCGNVTITLSGEPAGEYPEVQGPYKKKNIMWQGHHVYKHSNGHCLYVGFNGSWAVGSELGGDNWKLRGEPIHSCPSKSTRWEFDVTGDNVCEDCSSSVTITTD